MAACRAGRSGLFWSRGRCGPRPHVWLCKGARIWFGPRCHAVKGIRTGRTRKAVAVAALGGLIVLGLVVWRPALVAWHHGQARRWLERREDRQALESLQAALRLNPEDAETHFLLARVYRRLGELDRVPMLLRRAGRLGGDRQRADREMWLLMARLGRLREAEPHLAELLTDPRDEGMDICEAYVQGYFANLRIREAMQLLEAWQKDFPHDPQSHFMRGFLMQGLGRWRDAEQAYRQGLELDPGNVAMRCALGEVMVEMGRFTEAQKVFQECRKQQPDNPRVLYALAGCLYRQGTTERAREVLEELLAQAPEHFEGRRLMGEIQLALGNFQAAVEHLRLAIEQRSYDTTTHNALGQSLRALGKTEEAQAHFDYVARAEASLQRMERQLQLVVERPTDTQLRYEIGMTLLQYGSPHDGAKWLRSILELDPGHRPAREALAAYYEACGDPQQAAYHRQLAAS
ncbi:MAG TPA: tetratricopeptide repeat protein, partial [Planctomycetaceae bacterium]|nr:tetratricopeptide repeat protein [Planctomycetaceae bacterium]